MKEKEILEKLKKELSEKKNEYYLTLLKYDSGPYHQYCKGKLDLLNDIINYLETNE